MRSCRSAEKEVIAKESMNYGRQDKRLLHMITIRLAHYKIGTKSRYTAKRSDCSDENKSDMQSSFKIYIGIIVKFIIAKP